jgi:hypothetical protein
LLATFTFLIVVAVERRCSFEFFQNVFLLNSPRMPEPAVLYVLFRGCPYQQRGATGRIFFGSRKGNVKIVGKGEYTGQSGCEVGALTLEALQRVMPGCATPRASELKY